MEQRKYNLVPVALNKFLIYVFLSNNTAVHCWDILRSGSSLLRYQAEEKERGKECKWLSNHGIGSVQFSRSVISNSLRPHEPQHTRPPCPSPTPGVHANPCPSSRWCHPTTSSLLLLPSIFPSIRVFSNDSALHIRWPKYWSFSFNISPSNEHPGLISFRRDWLDLLVVQGTLKSLLQHQFKSINSSVFSFLYSPTLTSIHDHWKNHSLD